VDKNYYHRRYSRGEQIIAWGASVVFIICSIGLMTIVYGLTSGLILTGAIAFATAYCAVTDNLIQRQPPERRIDG
jgi:hypothetical protein